MPLKNDDPGEELTVIREWDGGFTWMAHPDALMQRASHALVVDEDVWVVDPLDAAGLDAKLASLGSVVGVVELCNQHARHADRLATRHEVPIHVPDWFDESARDFDAPVKPFGNELGSSGFELIQLRDGFWQEGALFHPYRRTLVVGDMFETALFSGEDGRVELFPLARLAPPRDTLGSLEVERLLVGHGTPVFENAQARMEQALNEEHRGTFSAFIQNLPTFARIAYSAARE